MKWKEKPPDPPENEQVYRIIKCPLKCVLKKYDILQPIIEKAVIDMNEIVILSYQFIRMYLLDKFTKKQELPIINKQFVLGMFVSAVLPASSQCAISFCELGCLSINCATVIGSDKTGSHVCLL